MAYTPELAEQARNRAHRIALARRERGRAVFNAAFGHTNTADFVCFHYAHNWQPLPDLTPAERHACRYALHMERKAWEATAIYDAWLRRTWTVYARDTFGYRGA